MPFSVTVPRFVIDDSWRFTKQIRMGHRNDGSDGNAEQQLVGVIGQNMVNLALCKPMLEKDTGFDGGVDFEVFGMTFDVKTMGRKSEPKPYYVNNLLRSQIKFNCNAYLFLSFNKNDSVLTFCGWLPKESFLYRATLYSKDSTRKRSDGSSFQLKADTFEIENNKLNSDFYSWPELVSHWHNYAAELI
jgi:hypothetical protein